MNELYKILNIPETEPISKVIELLKQGKDKTEVFDEARKQLDPKQHAIMDIPLRKAKLAKKDKSKDLNAIGIAYQKLIVKKEKAFIFGNQPKLNANPATKEEKKVLQVIERILHDIKEPSFNRKVADAVGSFTEGGETWYFKESETHNTYGFPTTLRVKAMNLTPKDGDLFYTYKDSKGDLLAFSRNYSLKENGKDVQYFETATENNIYLFRLDKGWELTENGLIKNLIGKIPSIFTEQDFTAWYDVQWMIERLETLLSNHAEVNDRNAYPILAIYGDISTQVEKGPGGAVKLKNGGKLEYVSWDNATASVKLEIENLIKYIQMITQTPNISFEEVKSLGALSGTALKMLFLDAHLKVMDKREIYDEYLQRRINLLKKIVGIMNPKLKNAAENLIIEPEIIPFMVENEKEQVEISLLKNGGKALESHEKSVLNYQGQDTEDYEKILKEEKESNAVEYFNPTSVE